VADRLLFSVVIPTCHRNDALALCLDRLAPGAQTLAHDRYEVIVTDDGSSTTAEEMIRYRYPWARWTQGPRRGPAANRNHGAFLANGTWLAFTDDDCLPEPGWLDAFAEATNGEARALEGAIHPIGNLDQDLAECPVNLTGGLFWSANVAVQRELFRSVGGFDERFQYAAHEDEDLKLRVKTCALVAYVPAATVSHPVRVRNLADAVGSIPRHAQALGLYYRLNAPRLGLTRWTVVARWIYVAQLRWILRQMGARHPRSVLLGLAWLVVRDALALLEYRRLGGAGRVGEP
jgi:GT2 family glycosyltransferase